MIVAHADGSCLGNPGPGGWAVVIRQADGSAQTLMGSAPDTTNNRMELMAALAALQALPADIPAVLFCDSEYVVKGLNTWLSGWQRRGWKSAQDARRQSRFVAAARRGQGGPASHRGAMGSRPRRRCYE